MTGFNLRSNILEQPPFVGTSLRESCRVAAGGEVHRFIQIRWASHAASSRSSPPAPACAAAWRSRRGRRSARLSRSRRASARRRRRTLLCCGDGRRARSRRRRRRRPMSPRTHARPVSKGPGPRPHTHVNTHSFRRSSALDENCHRTPSIDRRGPTTRRQAAMRPSPPPPRGSSSCLGPKGTSSHPSSLWRAGIVRVWRDPIEL